MRGRITSHSVCPSDLAKSWVGWGDIRGRWQEVQSHRPFMLWAGGWESKHGHRIISLYWEVEQEKCFKHFLPNLQVTGNVCTFLLFGAGLVCCWQMIRKVRFWCRQHLCRVKELRPSCKRTHRIISAAKISPWHLKAQCEQGWFNARHSHQTKARSVLTCSAAGPGAEGTISCTGKLRGCNQSQCCAARSSQKGTKAVKL